MARRLKDTKAIADEINALGGEVAGACLWLNKRLITSQAHPFPVKDYTREHILAMFQAVKAKWPNSRIKVALWNASQWSRIPFLQVTEQVGYKYSADIDYLLMP